MQLMKFVQLLKTISKKCSKLKSQFRQCPSEVKEQLEPLFSKKSGERGDYCPLVIRATAWAEIPSSRPSKPRFSVVVAFMET